MMLLFNAVLLSLDSLAASIALSPLFKTSHERWLLGGLFGLCDGLAVIAGFAVGGGIAGEAVMHQAGPLFALCWGVYCLAAAFHKQLRADRRFAFCLPPLMSLDNFTYGVGLGPTSADVIERAAILGAASFLLAMSGLAIAQWFRLPATRSPERLAGFGLITVAVILCLA